MTIPGINYPTELDTKQNLFFVTDGLRVTLAEDYNPGDTSVFIVGDEDIIRSFDSTGIITLTEQCSDPELRAISFYYSSRTLTSFDGLEILPGFVDVVKPKNVTNITQNVVSLHHNNLKNALIQVETFAGKKGETGLKPLIGTMEQRINYLRKLVLVPKAWFKANRTVGLAPLTVEFTDQSFRLGTDGTSQQVKHIWDFGDETSVSLVSIIDGFVPSNISVAEVSCPAVNSCKVEKIYSEPGIYDVKLTVINNFGTHESSDTVIFPKLINVRFPAPDEATIEIIERSGQILTKGSPESGPYTTYPKIRSPINSLIDVKIKDEIIRPGKAGSYTTDGVNRSYSGEEVKSSNEPIDEVINYTWSFSDDINHTSSKGTRALFGTGGYYDLTLRTDTEFGSYRITTYPQAFDIVEKFNLWLWNFNEDTTESNSYEFGLISETFKVKSNPTIIATSINSSFLDTALNKKQLKKEFLKNNGAIKNSTSASGDGGTALLYWASGRNSLDPVSTEKIIFSRYNGLLDTYTAESEINRPWNWVDLPSAQNLYFILGGITTPIAAGASPTNQNKDKYNLASFSSSKTTLSSSNYKNGANELEKNEVSYDAQGNPEQGHMSVYRSTWHSDAGYFLRNEGTGNFFRIKSFYKTSGNTSELFVDIRKLVDMPGAKFEGELVSLSQGVYFFNNSGSVAAFSSASGTWSTGGPGSSSLAFRSLQDTSIIGFDDSTNTLLATSDEDKTAYLSYDYGTKCFIKFNEIDTTFSSIRERPSGTQWQMYIF